MVEGEPLSVLAAVLISLNEAVRNGVLAPAWTITAAVEALRSSTPIHPCAPRSPRHGEGSAMRFAEMPQRR